MVLCQWHNSSVFRHPSPLKTDHRPTFERAAHHRDGARTKESGGAIFADVTDALLTDTMVRERRCPIMGG